MPSQDLTIPLDYHLHTRYSCDSNASMEAMGTAALQKGIPEIAFTEHLDLQALDPCNGFYDPPAYFRALEAARASLGPRGLTLRAGVEVGEMHRHRHAVQPVLEAHPYDVVLGSLHWVGDELVFDSSFFRREPAEAIRLYFGELAEMAQAGGFDVLSHLDVFKRTGYAFWGRFDITEWEDLVRPVWEACIANDIAPEINTSGLRLPVGQTQPTLEALRWYREMGGERLVIGSDAHRPEHVGHGLETALRIAHQAGFTHLCRFQRRTVVAWVPILDSMPAR